MMSLLKCASSNNNSKAISDTMRNARGICLGVQCRWRYGTRAISTTRCHYKDPDPLDALFEEMDNCDTSAHSHASEPPTKTEEVGESHAAKASSSPASDARVRLEKAKQRRLQRQLKDVGEELSALLDEKSRAAAQEANKAYVPSRAAKTFLSSAELIQEKAPQEFVPDEKSEEELAKVPSLQHSGCAAVITMVGVVAEDPRDANAVFPGEESESSCVEFTVHYEIPFMRSGTSMAVTVRAVGATLSAFARENVSVGDVVHVLGHLAPLGAPGRGGSLCAIYVLPAGGNISVVLSKAAGRIS